MNVRCAAASLGATQHVSGNNEWAEALVQISPRFVHEKRPRLRGLCFRAGILALVLEFRALL
jgi:hypothetical protein